DDEVENGRADLANLTKLPIGQPLPRISDTIDGPVPSAREHLLDLLDGSDPVGVPQPFPCRASRVDGPVPGRRQPTMQVANGPRHSRTVPVEPIPDIACPVPRPALCVAQPISHRFDHRRQPGQALLDPLPSVT